MVSWQVINIGWNIIKEFENLSMVLIIYSQILKSKNITTYVSYIALQPQRHITGLILLKNTYRSTFTNTVKYIDEYRKHPDSSFREPQLVTGLI